MPYGRAKWFLNCDEKLRKSVDVDEIVLLGFSPVRSKSELEFREYGIAISSEGLFHSCQVKDNQNPKVFNVCSNFISFAGLWKVKYDYNKKLLKFYYPNGKIIKLDISDNKEIGMKLENHFVDFTKIQELIFNKSLESKLKDMFKHIKKEGSRIYARENIVEAAIIVVIKERPTITDEDILLGVSQLEPLV